MKEKTFQCKMGNSIATSNFQRGNTAKLVHIGGFEEPAEPMVVSGGTAKFVNLRPLPINPLFVKGNGYFIGKDRSHAKGELKFYEKATAKRGGPDSHSWTILNWILEYGGIHRLTMREAGGGLVEKEFIVLENLFRGRQKTRLIDVKIGSVTSDRNWFGKSRFAAWRIKQIDKVTNSESEGFRMEGIENPPENLESIVPFLSGRKQTRKLMYQRLSGAEFLRYFFDTTACDLQISDYSSHLSEIEYSMYLHIQAVRELSDILLAVQSIPVPQKWVGSSIVFSFECSALPRREELAASGTSLRLSLLDWGRSELTSTSAWSKFPPWTKQDRVTFWSRYRDAVARLLYETARLYYHRFILVRPADFFRIHVFDYDRLSDDDFIGSVHLPLVPFGRADFPLSKRDGSPVRADKDHTSVITLALEHVPLEGEITSFFRLHILAGYNMPRMDFLTGHCDPYVVVNSADGVEIGRSKVCIDTANPEWNSVVDIPLTDADLQSGRLWEALQPNEPEGGSDLNTRSKILDELFMPNLDAGSMERASVKLRSLRQPPMAGRTKSMKYELV